VASEFYFYWIYWWFDYIMHFLGGLSIGLFVLWGALRFGFLSGGERDDVWIIMMALIAVLIIGISWEIFEYMNGLTQSTESYSLDVVHDLWSDVLGAFLAGFIVVKMSKNNV